MIASRRLATQVAGGMPPDKVFAGFIPTIGIACASLVTSRPRTPLARKARSLTGGRDRSSLGASALSESSRNAEPDNSEAANEDFVLLAAL